jgi:hypothetical protein
MKHTIRRESSCVFKKSKSQYYYIYYENLLKLKDGDNLPTDI